MTKLIKLTSVIFLLAISYGFFACSSEDGAPEPANLIIKIKFDPNQIRLNNIGQPSVIPDGNAAQTPDMKNISAHYLELAPSATTLSAAAAAIIESGTQGADRIPMARQRTRTE